MKPLFNKQCAEYDDYYYFNNGQDHSKPWTTFPTHPPVVQCPCSTTGKALAPAQVHMLYFVCVCGTIYTCRIHGECALKELEWCTWALIGANYLSPVMTPTLWCVHF